MLIGIMSDSHDNVENLVKAVAIFEREGVSQVFHCGDLTDVAMLSRFTQFKLVYVYGNMDRLTGEIKEYLMRQNPENFAGSFFCGELAGKKIAAMHGNASGQLYALINSGQFDYIFHGHTHKYRDLQVNGTRVINPGALGGRQPEKRSVCILDLTDGQIKRICIGV